MFCRTRQRAPVRIFTAHFVLEKMRIFIKFFSKWSPDEQGLCKTLKNHHIGVTSELIGKLLSWVNQSNAPKIKKRQKNVILTSFLKIFWPMYIVVVFLVVLKGNLVRFLFLWPGAVPCKIVVRRICSILLIHYVFISILIHKYSSNAEWFFVINIYYIYT